MNKKGIKGKSMNMAMKLLGAAFFILHSSFFISCSSDDDSPSQPAAGAGAPFQVMTVFAPGQLGDRGYADCVMSGVNMFDDLGQDAKADSLDTDFISTEDLEDARKMLLAWSANPTNLGTGGTYERRLLVLTETFMLPWLADVKDALRPTDEVLVLKATEADIASDYGLGGRLHVMNISAAASIRRFCRFMDVFIDILGAEGEHINRDVLQCFRLYDDATVAYRDSIRETLAEELGATSEVTVVPLSREVGNGVYSTEAETTTMAAAYELGSVMKLLYDTTGSAFAIVDMGSANAGWDLFWLGQSKATYFSTLMLDAEVSRQLDRFCIQRLFSAALFTWGNQWARQPVGTMPRATLHGEWDGYVVDNIPREEE